MKIRTATHQDIAAMVDIYAPYITHSTTSFEYDVPTLADFGNRVHQVLEQGLPWLVLEMDGTVLGYAYATPFGPRAAYRWTVSVSIYLAPSAQGKGFGSTLYNALFDRLTQQGYRSAYAIITQENTASLTFHQALGFTVAGIFPQIGYKQGKWLDVHYLCKFLNDETIAQQGFPNPL